MVGAEDPSQGKLVLQVVFVPWDSQHRLNGSIPFSGIGGPLGALLPVKNKSN